MLAGRAFFFFFFFFFKHISAKYVLYGNKVVSCASSVIPAVVSVVFFSRSSLCFSSNIDDSVRGPALISPDTDGPCQRIQAFVSWSVTRLLPGSGPSTRQALQETRTPSCSHRLQPSSFFSHSSIASFYGKFEIRRESALNHRYKCFLFKAMHEEARLHR